METLSQTKKGKYLQIFNYLKEFSKLRSKPVRDIDAQETQYPEKLWLYDIPVNELFDNIIRPNFNLENDFWIRVKKPKEPIKPTFPKLSNNLEKWIDKSTLVNEDEEPKLLEINENYRETLSEEDILELHKELQRYVNYQWIDDLLEYKEKLEIYTEEFEKYESLNTVYKHLFRIFNKTQQFGEEFELVVGVGLLNFKENDSSPKIFRHILTQRVDINFEYSQKDSQIYIAPNVESTPEIETDSIIDLFDQFDSQNIIDAEKSVEQYIKEKGIDSIFNNTQDALQMFAERVSPDGSYSHITEKPKRISSKPNITFAPALILRKRNTQSFTALYEKIIENIKNDTDDINIKTINDIINEQTHVDDNIIRDKSNDNTQIAPIFFPKEYNEEQLEIVEKAKRNNKVLVQGPPGTGKSHTIANLICHLLANGNKILITAYTKRALEVLKDKLPPEFQDLAVNLLSGDSSSIQDLQSSVNAINEELSRADILLYQKQINEFENELKQIKESIAEKTNNLIIIKEKATREHQINIRYQGTLTQIAEALEKDIPEFDWYKDEFDDIENNELISQVSEFINLNEKYQEIDTKELDFDIPDHQNLIPSQDLKKLASYKEQLISDSFSNGQDLQISCTNFDQLTQHLHNLHEIYNELDKYDLDLVQLLISSFKKGRHAQWSIILQQSQSVIDRLNEDELREFDKNIEISFPNNISIKQLKNDAQILLNYLIRGNALSGISFIVKKKFLSKEIKERLYFIDAVRVNGSPCDTPEEFATVLKYITFQQDFIELSDIWRNEITLDNSLLKSYLFYSERQNSVDQLLSLIERATTIKSDIEGISNLQLELFDKENLKISFKKTEFSKINEIVSHYQNLVNQSIAYLDSNSLHPIKHDLISAFESMNHHKYDELLSKIIKLLDNKSKYSHYKSLQSKVNENLPNTIKAIENNSFSKNHLESLKDAINFRNAQHHLTKLMDLNYEHQLIQNLNELEQKEKKLTARLASKKAWFKVVESLQQNRSLRQHLDAWVMAVKKIGKTGKGKRAMKFRKIAQKEMEHCKNSVPCWIMPLYKVAETIKPEQEMYDYVIIDEASQLGPDAIFLLYITKNIIIVGDDKQTSPEYVGVDANTMTPHIKRHLTGIPFSDYYGTEFSFFDHAKFFCDGVTVLREHFRCMPEIIEFSNRYFYAPDGKSLYPLKQYSENRLAPLVSVFCSNGYTEGRGSRIINEPEAAQITETIGKIVVDDKYIGKSIGIITLQGNQQANVIENLLYKKIGEKEFHKRKIVCGNSSSFQGDERDIIILSMVTAHNHNRSALVKPEDERRFNVAVSRAKEQIILFHSVQLEDLSNTNDLRYKLLYHFKNQDSDKSIYNTPIERRNGTQPEPFDSWFEVDVYNDIVNKKLSVIPQYEVAKGKYKIDMVTLLPDGTKIAIECDGDKWHGPEQYQNDIMRQKVLERCGWQFFRVRGSEYYSNRIKALAPLWDMIQIPEETEIILKNEFTESESKREDLNSFDNTTIVNSSNHDNDSHFDEIDEKINDSVDPETEPDRVLRYLNIFKSGTYILTHDNSLEADYKIPIKIIHRNGFLLQCYKSGHINKVYVHTLLSKKTDKEYMNGLNRDGELISVEILETDKIIGISFYENGYKKFKAHLTENISTREQLHLQGFKVIYNDFEQIEYNLLPIKSYDEIKRLVFQSFTANGKSFNNSYYDSEWAALRRYSIFDQNSKQHQIEFNPITESDNIVNLNNIVKIKFLHNDKQIKVKLVDTPTNGSEVINGVQYINISKPLAISIKGKVIGDRVRIGKTKNIVEILKIE